VSEDAVDRLECLYKVSQAAIAEGGLMHRHFKNVIKTTVSNSG